MEKKEKNKLNMKVQWAKFAVVLLCYLLFLYWVKSWLGLHEENQVAVVEGC